MNNKYTDYSDLYTGLDVTVDADVKKVLDDHFHFREVNNNSKFKFFYQRMLNLHYHQYELLALDELSEIPELIDYREYIINQKQAGKTLNDSISNITNKITSDVEGRVKNTTDSDTFSNSDALTGTVGTSNSYTEDDDLSHSGTRGNTGTQTNAQTVDGHHKELQRILDQGSVYGGAGGQSGLPDNFDWSEASGQTEYTDGAGTTQRTDNLSESTSATDNRDISGSGSETTTYNTNDAKSGTHSSTLHDEVDTTKSGSADITETGTKASTADEKVAEYNRNERMTRFETELRDAIWKYITNRHAIEVLFAYLECCFMPPSFDEE